MKYCGSKTGDERWRGWRFNAVRTLTGLLHHITTAGTYLYEKHPEPELDVALAPINQLPDDVLCYIFTLSCCEDAVHLPFNDSNIAPQITISYVCSVWRHVILSMSSLWNDFELFMDHAKDGEMLIEIVHDWLFRARSLPRSLALKFKADDSTLGVLKSEHWYKNIVKRLFSQFRFRKLSTPWSTNHWIQFLQLPAEKLSCVEDLHICCINPPSLSNFGVLPSQAPLDSFKKLTKLTSLRLDQSLRRAFRDVIYLQDSVFVHAVPWHQIRHIHLSIPTSVFFCFHILQKSSMVLETCSFVVIGHYSRWAEIQTLYAEPLYCPQLRTLGLDARLLPGQLFSAMILDPILLWIRMPNLKALTVGSSDWTSQELVSFSSLVGMQDVSNMQLKELTLYNHRSTMDVADLLRTFPSLKRIELLGHTVLDDDTINQLGSGLVAPCLEELIIHCDDIDLGELLRMIKVRSILGRRDVRQDNEPTPFRYVKLYRGSDLEEVPEEYRESIEEINRCDVQLIVELWDRYAQA
ncbi:hypothetical protein M378DRAFT_160745 [Amanita muscaria Koide BX008]|uniref:Uncharacterized protein n=1 Tax=Amanita muscaria (strain Koide BX008) TaxID=946122 RepID=A0A0C2WWZ5_AMAMK|nr:hypothetical protein M378DRAFT_160745 [Amanita muscaria Koide BX008]